MIILMRSELTQLLDAGSQFCDLIWFDSIQCQQRRWLLLEAPIVNMTISVTLLHAVKVIGPNIMWHYWQYHILLCLNVGSDALLEPGVYTMEDLRIFGRKQGWCPYFLARHMLTFANVVVYNYQYMLDPKVRPEHV